MPMRARGPLASVLAVVCLVVMGVAAPAGASPRVAASPAGPIVLHLARVGQKPSVTGPSCQIADPENITGAMLVNNQIVNGTWNYATGVRCGFTAADIALSEQLNFNGTKVDSKVKGFTGVPRTEDAILSSHFCMTCNGTWTFTWGQIVQAPNGFTFVTPPSGCVTVQSGVYLVCVQTRTVTL